jgi:hypothetical protein
MWTPTKELGGEGQEQFSRRIKVRKQFIVLIVVMLLASCSSFVQNTQSPSPTSTISATQEPSSEVDASWKTYTNAEAGFSIQYPANWQEQALPDINAGQMHGIALQGPEGAVELKWGIGFGGACPGGYQPIPVAKGTLSACHTQREDGTELWSLTGDPLPNDSFGGEAYTNDATEESRALVLQVVSTLSFP